MPEDTAGLLSGSSIAVAAATAIGLGAYIGRKKQYKRALVILLLAGLAAIVVWSLIHHRVLALPSDSTQKISLLTALSVVIAVGFYRYRPLCIFSSNFLIVAIILLNPKPVMKFLTHCPAAPPSFSKQQSRPATLCRRCVIRQPCAY